MAIQLLIAFLLAFFLCKYFGQNYIPWLEKKGFIQPLKEKVKEKIYSEKNEDMPAEE